MLIVYSTKLKEGSEVEKVEDGVTEEITEEVIDEISKEAGKKEKEIVEKYQPYTPTEDDLKKLQELFESKYGFGTQNEVVEEVKEEPVVEPVMEVTPTPTPDPIYFVDDEPIIEEDDKPKRLVYKKDE